MKEKPDRTVFEQLLGLLQIPEDVVKGNVLITMHGQEQLLIENFKGISSYTEDEIRLITRKQKLCVSGKKLKIDHYTKEEIIISGRILRLEYS